MNVDATTDDKRTVSVRNPRMYHIKILLDDVNAKFRSEIFKLVVGNKGFHKTNNSNNAVAVIMLHFHVSFVYCLNN